MNTATFKMIPRPQRLLPFALVAIFLAGFLSAAHAVQCHIDLAPAGFGNPPDPFSTQTTGATQGTHCGIGAPLGDENPNATELSSVTGIAGLVQIDKDGGVNLGGGLSNDNEAEASNDFWFNGTTAGQWFINQTLLDTFNNFVLIVKDGAGLGDGANPGGDTKWVWFELDENSIPKCVIGGAAFCGDWGMYAGHNISHMELWATRGGETSTTATQATSVPEPSTLFLLGSGLLVLTRAARKKTV